MGAPTGCVRKPRCSFSVVRYWAKCLKCGHKFIAYEMVGCAHSRGDKCDKCGSKRYEFVRSLTRQEVEKIEKDLRRFLYKTSRMKN